MGIERKVLAEEFNNRHGKVSAMSLDDLCREKCDVFINTTSVGMSPKMDETPLGDRRPPFSASTLVFDTIYNPMKTRLLTQAEGCGREDDQRGGDVRPAGGGAI